MTRESNPQARFAASPARQRLGMAGLVLGLAGCSDPSPLVSTVLISPASVVLTVEELVQLRAVPVDQEAQPVGGVTLEWSSTNPEVATVSQMGVVTAVAVGQTEILAESGRAVGRAQVAVQSP
jgi:hypothetical protein